MAGVLEVTTVSLSVTPTPPSRLECEEFQKLKDTPYPRSAREQRRWYLEVMVLDISWSNEQLVNQVGVRGIREAKRQVPRHPRGLGRRGASPRLSYM